MNKVKVTSLVCGGLISLVSPNLQAQQSSSPGSSTGQGQTSAGQAGSLQQGTSFGAQGSSSSTLGQSGSLQQGSSSGTLGSSSSQMSQQGQNVRLSNLMHATVQSQSGKTLGHIRDFTVDPQSGRVEFAVLSLSSDASHSSIGGSASSGASTGAAGSDRISRGASDTSTSGRETVPSARSSASGTLGSSSSSWSSSATGKLIPVPWQLFSQNFTSGSTGSPSSSIGSSTSSAAGSQTLVLNIDESKLQGAPSFDASNWNQLQQGSLDQQVYAHFGVSPMSGAGTSGSTLSGQGTSGSSSSSSQDSSTSSPQRDR